MPTKYRLTWRGEGSLDLSQILDVRGIPILFAKKEAVIVVDEGTVRHPLIQQYVGTKLTAEPIDVPNAAQTSTGTTLPVQLPTTSSTIEKETTIVEEATPIVEEPVADILTSAAALPTSENNENSTEIKRSNKRRHSS